MIKPHPSHGGKPVTILSFTVLSEEIFQPI